MRGRGRPSQQDVRRIGMMGLGDPLLVVPCGTPPWRSEVLQRAYAVPTGTVRLSGYDVSYDRTHTSQQPEERAHADRGVGQVAGIVGGSGGSSHEKQTG